MTVILTAGSQGSISNNVGYGFSVPATNVSSTGFILSQSYVDDSGAPVLQVRTYTGTGFTYNSAGMPATGTITGATDTYNGVLQWTVSGASVSAGNLSVDGNLAGHSTFIDDAFLTYLEAFASSVVANGSDYGEQFFAADGNDTIYGGAGDDAIWGYGGNDFINGNMGNDQLEAHGGNDTVRGGKGNDYIGVDVLYGGGDGAGNDQFFGDLGTDTVNGGTGDDLVRGGKEADSLNGGEGTGADTIWGDLGNDTITGGAGADIFAFQTGSGVDVITDFVDGDLLQISSAVFATAAAAVAAFSGSVLNFGGGNNVTLTGVVSLDAGDIVIV